MSKRFQWLTFLILLLGATLLACRAASVAFQAGAPVAPPLLPSPPASQVAGANLAPTATRTPPAPPAPAATDKPAPAITRIPQPPYGEQQAAALSADEFFLRVHPDGALYAGDRVSLEVIAPQEVDLRDRSLTVQVEGQPDAIPEAYPFERRGLEGRLQATLRWAWDTRELEAGDYTLTFTVLPDNLTWTEKLTLQPAAALPPVEAQSEWAQVESECCDIYYLTGSEAERDLDGLVERIDDQARSAASKFDIQPQEKISLVLISRLLGHGGFASDELAISYLDRNYSGNNVDMVLHHEMVHWYDSRLGGDLRPSILVEGLAVYLSGGHFKPEPLLPRAAALLDLEWYLPLEALANNFYRSQHEIGYLQAGALVAYMVERWGWDGFMAFYRDIHPENDHGGQAQAIHRALQNHFGLSLQELETDFRNTLHQQAFTPAQREDVRLTVLFFDTLRRYQQALDPSAYFLTAWLPDTIETRRQGIIADYLRRPEQAANLALELSLVETYRLLLDEKYPETQALLDGINASLDTIAPDVQLPQAGEPPTGESPEQK